MKKETLEEAAEKHCDIHEKLKGQKYKWSAQDRVLYNTFIDGAKWQAERMYSEEEVREVIRLAQFNDNGAIIPMTEEEIISQFKKK